VVAILLTAPATACPGLLPRANSKVEKAAVTAQDLVAIREIGASHPGAGPDLAASPAGDEIAFVVRRADSETNRYCVGLVVQPLGRNARPVLLDAGDVLLRDDTPFLGLSDMGSGRPLANRPAWSADGRSLYYLKAQNGIAQLWRVSRDGSGAAPLTNMPTDIVRFTLAPDGQLLVWSRPGLVDAREKLRREGREGWVYDRRFWTVAETRPLPLEQPLVLFRIDPVTGRASPASPADVDHANRDAQTEQGLAARSEDRRTTASVEPAQTGVFFAQNRLVVRRDQNALSCPDMVCSERVWAVWIRGEQVFVLREADADRGEMSLVRWTIGEPSAHIMWRGPDLLFGCTIAGTGLLCVRESATKAPSIQRVDLVTGGAHTILDLNPELSPERLGSVTRLSWRDATGTLAFGDFALPAMRRPGEKLPLIVVQYESRGFLRGGTGDEYPIHALAQAGYAVLSIHQPRRAVALEAGTARTLDDFQRIMVEGHMLRKRMAAALDAGVDAAIATGVVDPSRIGLTGMSDGAVTACYALIHRPRYAVLVLSGGCEEAETWTALIGPGWSERIRYWGMPDPQDDPSGYWDGVALSRNVERVRIPILFQVADRELLSAVQSWTALKAADRPVEMIVYPDEYHNKWQPAHRLAVYRTNVRWFDYWLRGREEPGQEHVYARWRQLRDRSSAAGLLLQ
jgi:dipeptidyl aminopeptidase/acylaminoacyl peptidase